MKVKECMCGDICYCTPDTKVSDVAKMMNENGVGCIPVCDDKKCVVGILTDTYTKNKKIELKRIDKEIELERLRLENFDKETEKMKLELDYTKQHLIETKKPSK